MACESDEFEANIHNLRTAVRKSFARIYASLKARELKTLRQLDAIRKQCQDDKDLKRNCAKNIEIKYDNESVLLENISNYGIIDFEKLNFDSSTFTLEDYVSPNDDHMYSYKTIEDVTKEEDNIDLEAIEEAALKEVISTDDCVCFVTVQTEDVSKKFRNLDTDVMPINLIIKENNHVCENNESDSSEKVEDEKCELDSEIKKINPTDDWLNSIKSQTETEPSQVTDVMEHSTITCT
ncbi:PREDICTED: uncharacterized protein LOC106100967 [Papilio polytes]|uniref:uncharacterized protein LOC106100967 n=1 Tax=Papilio polytes TaxID=76194 RepID=UPI00067643B1|nr:PREDICTED: uncharacterized protein LOC106100967 [Papilio polytes]